MKKKKLSFTARVIIIVTAFLLVVDVILGVVLINISANGTKEVLNNKMLEIAQIAARLVDGEEIKNLTKEDKENSTPEYTHNLDILSSFQASHDNDAGDLAYIYCLVKNAEGKIVFSIDPDPETTSIFLEEEAIETPALLRAMNEGIASVDPDPIVDRWGDLYTAYAPIFYGDNQIAGVVGVDVWANWYNKEVTTSVIAITSIGVVTITAGVLIALFITLSVRKRFAALSNEMTNLENELQNLIREIKLPQDIKDEDEKDINYRGDEIAILREQIAVAQKEIKQYVDYNKQRAYTDSLTKINNRLAYFEKVKDINSKLGEVEGYKFVVLVYDLNGLKDINDTYGHEFGDVALIYSARTIEEVYGKESIYRIGGDEIVVIIENVSLTDIEKKFALVEEIIRKINKEKNDLPAELSLSLGSAELDMTQDREFLDVFRRADKDMYEKKNEYYTKVKRRR